MPGAVRAFAENQPVTTIVNGTLTELKQLLPSAKVEYVEKQPTLEDVFFAIVGDEGKHGDVGNDRSVATDE